MSNGIRGAARRINPAPDREVGADIEWERRGLIWFPIYVQDPERDTPRRISPDPDRPMPLEHGDTCTCLWVVDHGETHHEINPDCPIHWMQGGSR